MIVTIVLLVFAVLALAAIIAAARRLSKRSTNLSYLEGKLRPVDVMAFRNLVDPQEEEFLRRNLPSNVFRSLQRQRIGAAVEYVGNVAYNAALLLRLGEAARASADPEIARAGRELVELALRIRIYALLAVVRFRLRMVLPGLKVSSAAVSNSYENLTGLVNRLGRLQNRSRELASAS